MVSASVIFAPMMVKSTPGFRNLFARCKMK